MKIAGIAFSALTSGVLNLQFVANALDAWPRPVDPAAGTWLVTGFEYLLRVLFSPQPPEGPFHVQLGEQVRVLRARRVAPAVAAESGGQLAPPAVAAFLGDGNPWAAFLRGERRYRLREGEGLLRGQRFVAEERGRLQEATAQGPRWQPGTGDFKTALQQGRLQVSEADVPRLWKLVSRDASLRGAFILRRYLFCFAGETWLDVAAEPATWRALPSDARRYLETALVESVALASPSQREALSALSMRESSLSALRAALVQNSSATTPFESLLGSGGASDRAAVLTAVDEATDGAPYLVDAHRISIDDGLIVRLVEGLLEQLQRRVKATPLGPNSDLWAEEEFRLAWLLLQSWFMERYEDSGRKEG